MMNIYKILEILNSGEYEKIEKHFSSYTVTLKEGGMIRVAQVSVSSYIISLFIPGVEDCIESWSFSSHETGWLQRKTVKDPLYDEVSSAFYNLYHEYSMKKLKEYSKYFPQ